MVAARNLERANPDRAGMLTASEAADQLGVKLGTLYAYVSRGWLKSYRRRIGRQALYRRTDIEALRGLVAPERGRRGRSLPPASSWVTVAQATSRLTAPGVIVAESGVSSIIDGQARLPRLPDRGSGRTRHFRGSLPTAVERRAPVA